MATQLEIYNAALGMIGHDRTISALPSTSTEAVRCGTFWAMARRAILGLHDWQWLRVETASTSATRAADGVAYLHAKPANMLRLVEVLTPAGVPLINRMTGSGIICDVASVIIAHVADSTDPTAWPDQIVDAVTAELAARICVPMTGKHETAALLHQQAGNLAMAAAGQNGSEQAKEA